MNYENIWTIRWRAVFAIVDIYSKLWTRLFGLSYQDRIMVRHHEYVRHECDQQLQAIEVQRARQRIRKAA